nr:MAG TPA: hypothetical protein [Caudoviricetes sp.]
MAKDKYIQNIITEIAGTLDRNDNNELVVWIDKGKDYPIESIDIVGLLGNMIGKQIALKLSDERDLTNE